MLCHCWSTSVIHGQVVIANAFHLKILIHCLPIEMYKTETGSNGRYDAIYNLSCPSLIIFPSNIFSSINYAYQPLDVCQSVLAVLRRHAKVLSAKFGHHNFLIASLAHSSDGGSEKPQISVISQCLT